MVVALAVAQVALAVVAQVPPDTLRLLVEPEQQILAVAAAVKVRLPVVQVVQVAPVWLSSVISINKEQTNGTFCKN